MKQQERLLRDLLPDVLNCGVVLELKELGFYHERGSVPGVCRVQDFGVLKPFLGLEIVLERRFKPMTSALLSIVSWHALTSPA